MPAYGSRAVYAEPRDDPRQMKQKAKGQGHFPQVARSSEELLHEQLKQIQRGKELNVVQQRRKAMDDRLNYELETERLMQDMRQGRAPGFRGLGGRMAGAAQAAQQFANATQ